MTMKITGISIQPTGLSMAGIWHHEARANPAASFKIDENSKAFTFHLAGKSPDPGNVTDVTNAHRVGFLI